MPTPAPQPQVTGQAPENPERVRLVVHFEFAKATPTKAGVGELRKTLSRIREGDAIRIEGHTDDIGTAVFNDRLARKRAEFVAVFKDGSRTFVAMSRKEVEKIRDGSRGYQSAKQYKKESVR